jgi:hypothetical protein
MRFLDEVCAALTTTSFRHQFHLRRREVDYLLTKGLAAVLAQASDFVAQRL